VRRDLAHSLVLLLLGGTLLLLLFAVTSRIWEFMDPFPRVPLFLLWLVAPVLLMAFNSWFIGKYLISVETGRMFRGGAAFFLAAGAFIYGRILLVPEAGQMEINLVFLFGPFYHFFAVVAVTVAYLGRSVHLLLSRRRPEEEH
jgi:hypothetical protein